ncbi:MAG TPA: mechanosensitive ion channel domain-containing protein [Candidatus Acidoferrales bacterium]|nr:mechanosensitive ion channel domain-containing protein [Candidatus Acidoferrales bacterium]
MNEALPKLLETILLFLPRIGASLLVILGFWFLAVITGNLVSRLGNRTRLAGDVINLLARAGKVGLIIFGLVTALGTIGINVSALVAGLGLTGFALGFALKDALSNMLAGVLILSYRPFRHGQRIEVSGYQGTVANIDFRYTTLQTEEKTILLPNANLFTNTVVVFRNGAGPNNKTQPQSSPSSKSSREIISDVDL